MITTAIVVGGVLCVFAAGIYMGRALHRIAEDYPPVDASSARELEALRLREDALKSRLHAISLFAAREGDL
jgi:hypothetical protein